MPLEQTRKAVKNRCFSESFKIKIVPALGLLRDARQEQSMKGYTPAFGMPITKFCLQSFFADRF